MFGKSWLRIFPNIFNGNYKKQKFGINFKMYLYFLRLKKLYAREKLITRVKIEENGFKNKINQNLDPNCQK